MSLNMYLGEVQAQTESMNASCTAIIQSMEQTIDSIDAFIGDAVLQGKTYDSAKMFFLQTFRPLAQGIIYLCEELIHQNNAFPTDFQAEVATVDVVEQEILEQIRELERMIAEVQSMSAHMSGMDALLQVYYAMKRKLEDKLQRLYQFNASSSDNYSTALELAANIAKGLAEVQSGKGFSATSGTFSTKELNMEWATSIQTIADKRARQTDNLKDSNLLESDTIDDTRSSPEENGDDVKKAARDLTGELTGEYDARRVMEGIDPETGAKLSWWERSGAGIMLFAGVTPVGKGIKILKSGKKVAKAIDAATRLEKKRETLANNSKVGQAFEKEMETIIKNEKVQSELNSQVTIMTKSGIRTRVDIAGKDIDGKIDLIELKSSPTAPLTKNQKKAFPEIEESGAIIRSRNKPPFDYLEEIPPTKVNVIRKND
ncbi:pre-toxin TG domain-containing protein [Bacillus manliponensis]|uniref:pre-toxin TG domain-containing protein n=1 Tax=Bacillus manliponensis TaxID=574376 RepID=UPI003514AD6A